MRIVRIAVAIIGIQCPLSFQARAVWTYHAVEAILQRTSSSQGPTRSGADIDIGVTAALHVKVVVPRVSRCEIIVRSDRLVVPGSVFAHRNGAVDRNAAWTTHIGSAVRAEGVRNLAGRRSLGRTGSYL